MNFWEEFKKSFKLNEQKQEQKLDLNYPRFNLAKDKWDEYFYNGTTTFRSLQGIRNSSDLKKEEEREIKTNHIAASKIEGKFDLQHLKDIHKKLFENLYAWAGEPRVVNMLNKKGEDVFIRHENFEKESQRIFNGLKDQNYLQDHKNNPNQFLEKLVNVYLEINKLHYFREGNGRTQNIFIDNLAEKNGYKLDLASIAQDKHKHTQLYVAFDAYNKGSNYLLMQFFADNLKKIETPKISETQNKKVEFNEALTKIREAKINKESQGLKQTNDIKHKL